MRKINKTLTDRKRKSAMKATIKRLNEDGKIRQNRKEKHFYQQYSVAVKDGKEIHVPVMLRLYGTGAMSYACLWVQRAGKDQAWGSGGGRAGGYGYHRPSQAAGDAIINAGIELSEDIGGRGDSAIEHALKAIAEAYGYKNPTILSAHA